MTPLLHAIAQFSALRAIDSLVEGTVIGVFAALILRAARHHNAAARFGVSFSALMAIAIIPFLGGVQTGISGTARAALTVPESWAMYLFAAWAVVAGFFLFRLGKGLWHLHALRRSCEPVDVRKLDPLLQTTLQRPAAGRTIELCTSDQVRVPTALGLLKPAVVLPRWVLEELTSEDLNQILLHELAHLRRRDDWTNFAQQFVRAVFFFHPAVWWIERRVALEREMACDDAVLAETASPRAYAECLAHLAEKSFARRTLALAQAALGKVRQTSERVAEILNPNRPRSSAKNWKPAAALVAGFAIVCAVGSARAPKLIAFQDAAAHPAAHASAPSQSLLAQLAGGSNERTMFAPIVPAKLNIDQARPKLSVARARKAAQPVVLRPAAGSMVHLTGSGAVAPPLIETLFVVIESPANGNSDSAQPWRQIQIQMWHVLLLHNPDGVPPPKKT